MGRRAKNKQSAPQPFEPHPSPKKLGKRKAEADVEDGVKPSKKIKDLNGKSRDKSASKKMTTKQVKGSGTRKMVKATAGDEVDDDDGSEGWEDVEDGVDLKAQTM